MQESSMVTQWTRVEMIMGFKLGSRNFCCCFMQSPCCTFTLYKEFLCQSYVFFEDLSYHKLQYITVWPHAKRRSHLTRFSFRNTGMIGCRKLKVRERHLQWHNTHAKFNQNPSSDSRVESRGQTWLALYAFNSWTSCKQHTSWGSLVSIVSDYRLDEWGSNPGTDKEFFL
jgi:hypothetical protein